MVRIRNLCLLLVPLLLLLLMPGAAASPLEAPQRLPASEWWLVVHSQCDNTLHWINPSGEFAAIPRPTLPDEAPVAACGYRAMHISQDGRYLVQTGALTNGNNAVGFYDLQTGEWLRVFEAVGEAAHLGSRYSSDANNHIAVSFSTTPAGAPGWRVILFDMATGDELYEMRSDGSEIAGFVGGEFLATTPTVPTALLLGEDAATTNDVVVLRFDGVAAGASPLGAVAWYPLGAPGIGQPLVSSPYTLADIDVLPNGHAIQAYSNPGYAAGPPFAEAAVPITSNTIGLLRPASLGEFVGAEPFFADGSSTVFGAHWGADERLAVFQRYDGTTARTYWIRVGTAVLTPLAQPVAQMLGVPNGFVYNTADGIYYLSETTGAPTGPIFADPALAGSMAFVWATAFGNPPLALDTPFAGDAATQAPPLAIVTATPDNSACRIRSADGGNVNIRSGPDTGFSILGIASGSLDLPVVGYNGEWYVVTFSGAQGWMAGWVSTLIGACGGLPLINAPAAPPTAVPPAGPTPIPGGGGTSNQPDLYVSEFALDPGTPIQGQPVNVRLGVYNQGGAPVSGTNFHIDWYPGENYPTPACSWDLDSMAARGGRILTCSYAGYPSWYGSINTLVVIDTGNTVAESDEGNNRFTRGISVSELGWGGGGGGGQPDLFVSEFALDPGTPTQGQPVNVRVGVYNQGTAAVSSGFHIVWFPGENYPAPACEWDLDSMAAGGGRILTCSYAGYPSWYGSINTRVVVDTGNSISESNEGNNAYVQGISVSQPGGGGGGQPDLFVSEFALDPGTPTQGQPVNVRVGVYNQGSAAVSSGFHVDWYPGENYPSPACGWDLDSMSAGGGRILTCTYAGYPSWYGSINTRVVVDTGNSISESNEGNNAYTQGIQVSQP